MFNNRSLYYIFFVINSFLLSASTDNILELNISTYNNIEYIALEDFLRTHQLHTTYYEAKDKIEIVYKKNRLYFSPSISYCKINDQIYNLVHPILYKKRGYYIPVKTFYKALELSGLPLRIINQKNKTLYVNPNIHNINKLTVSNKQNGTLIKLITTKVINKVTNIVEP